MSRLPSLRHLEEIGLLEALAALDAAEALIALGWPVTPPDHSQARWKIFDELLTTTELLVIASFVAICPRVNRSRP